MKTTLQKTNLLALILMGTSAIAGCSSFTSPTAGYVKPGELCTDVSNLPDPNAPVKDQSVSLRNTMSQYGYGGKREESPERLLLQADSYFEQKRFHDSARLYKKYLITADASAAPPDLLGTIHYRIGFVASKKTFYSEARDEFAQALQFSPVNNEYLFAYAKACYDSGDYQTADQQFSALLLRDPAYPEAQRYYGLTLLEGSNRANALQPLTNSVGALQAYALLTDKYYEVGDLEHAAQAESQTIQIAAQNAQPIPRFPHKERLMANAQNATYAQTLGNMISQTPVAPQNVASPQPFVSQYAQPQNTPIPSAPMNAAPATQFAQISPVVPQFVAAEPNQNRQTFQTVHDEPQTSPTAQPVEEPVAVETKSDPTPVAPPDDPVEQELAQAEPLAPQAEHEQAPVQYAQISPVPVDATSSERPAPQGPAVELNPNVVREQLQTLAEEETPEPVFSFAQEAPLVEDEEDCWDDSAFATSGAAIPENAGDPNAQYQSPQPELPMPPEQGYTAPQNLIPAGQNQSPQPSVGTSFFSQTQRRASRTSSRESFELARAQMNALEALARFADQAHEYAQVHREYNVRHADREFVGYLASVSRKSEIKKAPAGSQDAQRRAPQNANERELNRVKSERAPISMVASELPPSPPQSGIHFSNNVETIEKPEPIAPPKKRAVKADAHVGNGNPGLFVATAARKRIGEQVVFRPGSIEPQKDVNQSVPDEIAVKIVQRAKRRTSAELTTLRREQEWIRDEKLLERLVEEARFIDDVAVSYYEPFIQSEEEEWDESAFATSGASSPQTVVAGGFGDYMPPNNGAASMRFQTPAYVAQLNEPQPPVAVALPQSSGIPGRQSYAPQTPVNNAAPALQQAQRQTPVLQTPNATTPQASLQRRSSTPEERLEAARRAGANVVELSPEQYRQAVATGLGQQPR